MYAYLTYYLTTDWCSSSRCERAFFDIRVFNARCHTWVPGEIFAVQPLPFLLPYLSSLFIISASFSSLFLGAVPLPLCPPLLHLPPEAAPTKCSKGTWGSGERYSLRTPSVVHGVAPSKTHLGIGLFWARETCPEATNLVLFVWTTLWDKKCTLIIFAITLHNIFIILLIFGTQIL